MGAAISSAAVSGDAPVVFVSYSREDADWRRKFVKMLEPSVRRHGFELWSDERILAGERWSAELDDAIAHAEAGLLLVSSDFLGSEFIMGRELPALCARGVVLVPVLVRPCLWEGEPVLAGVQWGHDPVCDGPLSEASAPEGQIVRVSERIWTLSLPSSETGRCPRASFGLNRLSAVNAWAS
jgi:hypothetical protein